MVKHIQAIFQQQPTNCLYVFDDFLVLVLKGLIAELLLINLIEYNILLIGFLNSSNKTNNLRLNRYTLVKKQENRLEAESTDFLKVSQSKNVLILFLFEICIICLTRSICQFVYFR